MSIRKIKQGNSCKTHVKELWRPWSGEETEGALLGLGGTHRFWLSNGFTITLKHADWLHNCARSIVPSISTSARFVWDAHLLGCEGPSGRGQQGYDRLMCFSGVSDGLFGLCTMITRSLSSGFDSFCSFELGCVSLFVAAVMNTGAVIWEQPQVNSLRSWEECLCCCHSGYRKGTQIPADDFIMARRCGGYLFEHKRLEHSTFMNLFVFERKGEDTSVE